eukprot:PhM_4_TR3073/c0_g2_i1/m.102582
MKTRREVLFLLLLLFFVSPSSAGTSLSPHSDLPHVMSITGCIVGMGPSNTQISTVSCPPYPETPTRFTIRTYGIHQSKIVAGTGTAPWRCASNPDLCKETFVLRLFEEDIISCSNVAPTLIETRVNTTSGYVAFVEEYFCVITPTSAAVFRGQMFEIAILIPGSHLMLDGTFPSSAKYITSFDPDAPDIVGIVYAHVPEITAVSGCGAHTITACPTTGTLPAEALTIKGRNLWLGVPSWYIGTTRQPAFTLTVTRDAVALWTVISQDYHGEYTTSGGGHIVMFTSDTFHDAPNGTRVRATMASTETTFRVNFQPRPVVDTITGCARQDSARGVSLCTPTSVITITGSRFDAGATSVKLFEIGGSASTPMRTISVFLQRTSTVISFTCDGALGDANTTVLVVNSNGESSVLTSGTLAMRPPCPTPSCDQGTCDATTGECDCHGSLLLGYWRVNATTRRCSECSSGYYGSACKLQCSCGFGVCEEGVTGTGKCVSCLRGYAGPSCAIRCGTAGPSPSQICYGRGVCNEGPQGNGICTCTGNYGSPTCEDCSPHFYGAGCALPCPQHLGRTCSGNGVCHSGVAGNGTCICNFGYAGALCNIECEGGAGNVCNQHGTCDALTGKCTCYRDDAHGYWASSGGSVCDACLISHANSTGCRVVCPGVTYSGSTPTAVCSGHGLCNDGVCQMCTFGYCGSECGESGNQCLITDCPSPTQWGNNCSNTCPGTISSSIACTGHGLCGSGVRGTGRCFCTEDINGYLYGGDDCSIHCAECGPHISCDITGCLCPTGSAGQDCQACPRAVASDATTACGGASRGECRAAPEGVGSVCFCNSAYYGPMCASTCPAEFGGEFNACNNHGRCSDAGCSCYRDTTNGYWQGDMCTSCLYPWGSSSCTKTCAGYNATTNTPCNGHGTCDGFQVCQCYYNDTHGYWALDTMATCRDCAHGYWGPKCQAQCEGGACNPCFGHGQCSQGTNGTGFCKCDGNFGGSDCQNCQDLFFGPNCEGRCTSAHTLCSGHGQCNDGTTGTGVCSCMSGYTGDECQSCAKGYYRTGGVCVGCPGSPPCNSHGTCQGGTGNNPMCVCDTGYVGSTCSKSCPLASNSVSCNGFTCRDAGTLGAQCVCPSSSAVGFYTGRACDRCVTGWTGTKASPGCNMPCPGGVTTPCSLSGTCQMDGTCACDTGYVGEQCQRTCPGPRGQPCYGHGACTQDAQCLCYENVTHGYWSQASSCRDCVPSRRGASCTYLCPTYDGKECNGMAKCNNLGECRGCVNPQNVVETRCGSACELSGPACLGLQCTQTHQWGPTCDGVCLGTTMDSNNVTIVVCSGHGVCSNGRLGNGLCACDESWVGKDCSKQCQPCGTHGTCNTTTGVCECESGYAGSSCSIACPESFGSLCGGRARGTCHEGNAGNGTCTCRSGFAGSRCQLTCPCRDGTSTDCEGIPCNNQGTCRVTGDSTTTCTCLSNSAQGFFQGVACQECVFPYELPSCTQSCPGVVLTSTVQSKCSGHGRCIAATLTCECESNSVSGFWTGSSCNECQAGFYGSKCTLQCPGGSCRACSGHGACSQGVRGDGKCLCYANIANGYWTGERCSTCVSGYWGRSCTQSCPRGQAGSVCSGRGTCDDGTLGSGTCMCHDTPSGRWGGSNCGTCRAGYFGPVCIDICPRDPTYVHCADLKTTATCVANTRCTWTTATTSCEQKPCSGHGTCNDGVLGTGKCQCDQGYAGPYCTVACPVGTTGLRCNGHGTCNIADDVGYCVCNAHFTGKSCSECEIGLWGSECDKECGAGAGLAQAQCRTTPDPYLCLARCSGRSLSNGGCNITDGSCQCKQGFGGSRCEIMCQPSSDNPCYGHGVCGSSGACSCHSSCEQGHWATSTQCRTCAPGYVGHSCNFACPYSNGLMCGGGTCVVPPDLDGQNCSQPHSAVCVSCPSGRCHGPQRGCELSGVSCDGTGCPAGFFGSLCDKQCPRSSGSVGVCSGHGVCDDGRKGSGLCACASGWRGSRCDLECPLCLHGVCVVGSDSLQQAKAVCRCNDGYVGPNCTISCPGDPRFPCTTEEAYSPTCAALKTNTTCLADTTCLWIEAAASCIGRATNGACYWPQGAATAACACAPGLTGSMCDITCPGVVSTNSAPSPCNSHGTCTSQVASTNLLGAACVCERSATRGWWDGPACQECMAGWAGENCLEQCSITRGASGVGFSRRCDCLAAFYGTGCEQTCPGTNLTTRVACHGHGVCSDGWRGTGTCACYNESGIVDISPVYFQDCAYRCVVASTCSSYNIQTTRCDELGRCVCKADRNSGYWGGARCDTCVLGYWGDQCKRRCNCNNHGSCNRISGKCVCFQDAVGGYWGGTNCDTCSSGYVGSGCDRVDVKISVDAHYVPPTTEPQVSPAKSFSFTDTTTGRMFVGSRPLLIVNVKGKTATTDEMQSAVQATLGQDVVRGAFAEGDVLTLIVETGATVGLRHYRRATLVPVNTTTSSDPFGVQRRRSDTQRRRSMHPLVADNNATVSISSTARISNATYVLVDNVIYGANDTHTLPGYDLTTVFPNAAPVGITPCEGYKSETCLVAYGAYNSTQWEAVVLRASHGKDIGLDVAVRLSPFVNVPACHVDTTSGNVCIAVQQSVASESHLFLIMERYDSRQLARTLLVVSVPFAEFYDASQASTKQSLCSIPAGAPLTPHTGVCAKSAIIPMTTASNATATTYDSFTAMVYVGVHSFREGSTTVRTPSTILKINAASLGVEGSTTLQTFQGEPEVVVAMTIDAAQRTLYVTPGISFVRVISLMLFAVQSIHPRYVAREGGTPITVFGIGFVPNSTDTKCVFCRGCDTPTPHVDIVIASNTTTTRILCHAPTYDAALTQEEQANLFPVGADRTRVSAKDPGCLSTTLEIAQLGSSQYTQNRRPLRRIAPPNVVSVHPGEGILGSPQLLTVKGTGFVNTTRLMCAVYAAQGTVRGRLLDGETIAKKGRLTPSDPNGIVYMTSFDATFVDSNTILCVRRRFAEPTQFAVQKTYIAVSLDGWVFGPSTATYNVTGTAAKLDVLPHDPITIVANATVRVPPFHVHITDETGHWLTGFGTLDLRVTVPAQLSGAGYNQSYTYRDWANALNNIVLQKPKVLADASLTYAIQLFSVQYGWSGYGHVRVVRGPFSSIVFSTTQASTTDNVHVLTPGPIVKITDSAGNDVLETTTGLICQLYVIPIVEVKKLDGVSQIPERNSPFVNTRLRERVGFVFSSPEGIPIRIEAVFGETYKLRAVVKQGGADGNSDEVAVDSPITIRASACPLGGQQYQKTGTKQCMPCPDGALCDGFSITEIESNYWRYSNTSVDFYRCHPTRVLCSVSNTSMCVEGHTGPLCSVCIFEPDNRWGKVGDQCGRCPEDWVSDVIIGLMVLAIAIVVSIMIQSALSSSDKDILIVLIKMFINHVQISSQLGRFSVALPVLVKEVFRSEEQASSVNGEVAALACRIPHNFYNRFVFIMILPVIIPTIAIVRSIYDPVANAVRESAIGKVFLKQTGSVYVVHESEFHAPAAIVYLQERREAEERRKRREGRRGGRGSADILHDEVITPSETSNTNTNSANGPKSKNKKTKDFCPSEAIRRLTTASIPAPTAGQSPRRLANRDPFHLSQSALEAATNAAKKSKRRRSKNQQDTDGDDNNKTTPRVVQSDALKKAAGAFATAPKQRKNRNNNGSELPMPRLDLRLATTPAPPQHEHDFDDDEEDHHHDDNSSQQQQHLCVPDEHSTPRSGITNRRRRSSEHTERVLRAMSHTSSVRRVSQQEEAERNMNPVLTRFLIVCVTLTFLIYITLVQTCANMLKCDDVVETTYELETHTHRFLSVDRSIDCDTDTYRRYFNIALIFLTIYGLGLPFGTISIVRSMKHMFSEKQVFRMFTFMVSGYRTETWYWETTVLVKKMGLVVIISFVTDLKLQTYLGMWFLTMFLAVHWHMQPFSKTLANRLEGFSMTMIISTLNVGLLYEWDKSDGEVGKSQWYFLALTLGILVMIFTASIVFLYYIVIELKRKILSMFDFDGDGVLEWWEMKVVIALKSPKWLRAYLFDVPKRLQEILDDMMRRRRRSLRKAARRQTTNLDFGHIEGVSSGYFTGDSSDDDDDSDMWSAKNKHHRLPGGGGDASTTVLALDVPGGFMSPRDDDNFGDNFGALTLTIDLRDPGYQLPR